MDEIPAHWTSLHYAVTEGIDCGLAKQALEDGVPVDARTADEYQATALHRAAGHSRIPGIIELLLEAGADIEATNGKGRTPLHLAYRYDAPTNIIDTLLNHGASPSAKDLVGLIPSDLAIEENR